VKFHIEAVCGIPDPVFDDEAPPKSWLLAGFLMDMRGQEDLYLGEIAKAEAGATITDLYNNHIDAQLYPDGRVILEELRYNAQDEIDRGPPARIEITLAQAKQLILDWLAAKQSWYAQREQEGAVAGGGGQAPA
jgi:hypothetical protein